MFIHEPAPVLRDRAVRSARESHKLEAVGSNPTPATKLQSERPTMNLFKQFTNGQSIGYIDTRVAIQMVFNRENQVIIELSATSEYDSNESFHYRWINPDYLPAIKEEFISRNIDFTTVGDDDNSLYTDVENISLMLIKIKEVFNQ